MREVVITDNAKEDIEHIASFLKIQFSNQVKTDFLVNVSEKLLFIEKMPFMYPKSIKNERVRRCVIHKNTVCYYEVTNEHIIILSVSDARIDPDTLRF